MKPHASILVAIVVAVLAASCVSVPAGNRAPQGQAPPYIHAGIGIGGAAGAVLHADAWGAGERFVAGIGASLMGENAAGPYLNEECPDDKADVTYLGTFSQGESEVYALIGTRLGQGEVFLVGILGVSTEAFVELVRSDVTSLRYQAYWPAGGPPLQRRLCLGAEIRFSPAGTKAIVAVGVHNRRGVTLGGGLTF